MTTNIYTLSTLNASFGQLLVTANMGFGETPVFTEKYLYAQPKKGYHNH
ncbi:MAG: hypothetical protein ACQETA_02860 [Bacteroidota bacterium]